MKKLLVVLLGLALAAAAQTTINGGRTVLGVLDASGASKTSPIRIGPSDPGTCDASVREMFYNASTNTLKVCTATNTWTAAAGGGGGYDVFDWTVMEEKEDFVGTTDSYGGGLGKLPWTVTTFASGNGGVGPSDETTANHPGVVIVMPGNVSSGGTSLYLKGKSVYNPSANFFRIEWIAAELQVYTNKTLRLGLSDNAGTATPANSIAWRYIPGTDSYYTLEACAASTCTTAASAVARNGSWHRFKIWWTATGTIHGCIDACASDLTISSNVPTAGLAPVASYITSDADSEYLFVDAMALQRTSLTRW